MFWDLVDAESLLHNTCWCSSFPLPYIFLLSAFALIGSVCPILLCSKVLHLWSLLAASLYRAKHSRDLAVNNGHNQQAWSE